MRILTVLGFHGFHLHQIQKLFQTDQENERQDIQLSIEKKKKNFCQMFTDNARLKNVPPPLYLTRTLKPCHKRNEGRKVPEK